MENLISDFKNKKEKILQNTNNLDPFKPEDCKIID